MRAESLKRGNTLRCTARRSGSDAHWHDLRIIARVIALALAIGVGTPGRAAEPPAAVHRVYVGVYVKQIHGISLKDSMTTVDFHIWFRWTDDGLKPLETFDLVNGRIESK